MLQTYQVIDSYCPAMAKGSKSQKIVIEKYAKNL
jgi:hypothetical protein